MWVGSGFATTVLKFSGRAGRLVLPSSQSQGRKFERAGSRFRTSFPPLSPAVHVLELPLA